MAQVIKNSFEDFSDDFLTTVVMKNAKQAFDPLRKDLEGNPDAFHQALSSAIATLQMGVSMMAIRYVTNTLLPNLGVRGLAIYSYILSGKVARGLSRVTSKRLRKIKSGRLMSKALSVLTDGAQERGQRAKIANDMVSHMEQMQIKKEKIANDTRLSLDNVTSSYSSNTGNKSIALYTEKTKTGTWTSLASDKKLYEKATGQPLQVGVSWSKLYKKLNSFQQFAIDAEEKIINQAQVQFDTFSADGKTKV